MVEITRGLNAPALRITGTPRRVIKQIDPDADRGGAELKHARGEVWIQFVEHQQAATQQDVIMVRLRRHLARPRGIGERVTLDQGDLVESVR
ncbi:hypothetical protein D3C81_1615970 [compost metagenome]